MALHLLEEMLQAGCCVIAMEKNPDKAIKPFNLLCCSSRLLEHDQQF